jgi:hypothetical protein
VELANDQLENNVNPVGRLRASRVQDVGLRCVLGRPYLFGEAQQA